MRYSVTLILMATFAAAGAARGEVRFNRDIRPIMADTCFRCHGPDKSTRMAGLRLDLREEAVKPTRSGVTPIVPGDPDKSAIVDRVFSKNAARIMPPKHAHKDLTEKQKETIRQWVQEGAKYEGHWAYQPVRRPEPPAVASTAGTVRNPIDAFIQERLTSAGLQPSPEADRRTLLRRVHLDLTGLPPTLDEIRAFEADSTADAYERVVDRLLASPRYAEKQAIHWLDAVRYADTCGFHGDNLFPAWPYRDYVLRSFRDNKPFDQFTREQLAGDLLPNATTEQKVASAYNRLTRTSAEGGVQPKEYLAKYGADRVRTLSAVWLGATMGCAECHDHKFDPILSKDFYAMKAFFADIKETGLVPDRGPKAWGALLPLPTAEQSRKLEEAKSRVAAARAKLSWKEVKPPEAPEGEEPKPVYASPSQADPVWEKELLDRYRAGEFKWTLQRPVAAQAQAASLTVYNSEPLERQYQQGGSIVTDRAPGNGLVAAGGANPDREVYTVTLKPGAGSWRSLGIEAVRDESLPGTQVARGSDRFVLTEVELEVDGRPVSFSLATSGMQFPAAEHPPMAAIDGDPKTGWGLATYGEGRNPFLALRLAQPLTTGAATTLTLRLRQESEYRRATIGRFRVALSAGGYSWPESGEEDTRRPRKNIIPWGGVAADVLRTIEKPPAKRTVMEAETLSRFRRWLDASLLPAWIELAKAERERDLLEAAIPRVVVSQSTEARVTRVLARGNFMDESGEVVEPAVPQFLGALNTGGRATRLDLANWIVSKDNPLTARVYVNRAWRQFFGAGLSKVLDDLGSQGELPTHAELLDWLAAEFMERWDMKQVVRTIVLSHTYRQSSKPSPAMEEKDPENRLLARQTRFRVDAELVRDIALSVSGLLKERFGGPSVRPVQPEGYLAALNFPKRDYSPSTGDDQYRRGVYVQWQRTFLHPSMMTFDAPSREECTVNRVNSNTPLQALVLLNDPIYLEAARVFGQRMAAEGGREPGERIEWAFETATGRRPGAEEKQILTDLYRKSLQRFAGDSAAARELLAVGEAPAPAHADPVDLAASMTVARAILNLHETVTRN